MQRKKLIVERTILTVSSLLPNEIKYFPIESPNNNYHWFIYTINTQTVYIGVNDFSNGGIRLKNNTSESINNRNVELYWFTIG